MEEIYRSETVATYHGVHNGSHEAVIMGVYTTTVHLMGDHTLEFRAGDHRLFAVTFVRTIRLPEDGQTYPLPPGLGEFPLRRVSDYRTRVPEHWLDDPGSVFLPIYQREALWLSFSTLSRQPVAVKVGAGRINAVTGEPLVDELQDSPQDYMVCPVQPWLDGFNTGEDSVQQFVAMPLGSGYTMEGQLTGSEQHGGLQLTVYPPDFNLTKRRPTVSWAGSKEPSLDIFPLSQDLPEEFESALAYLLRKNRVNFSKVKNSQKRSGRTLLQTLSEGDYLEPDRLERLLVQAHAWFLGVEYENLQGLPLDPELANLLPECLAWRYHMVPVRLCENTLRMAMADTTNVIAIDDARLLTGYEIEPVRATAADIWQALQHLYDDFEVVEVEETMKDISAQDFGALEMGLGKGGTMTQNIYQDPYGLHLWDQEKRRSLNVHFVDPRTWFEITGELPPATPVDAQTYAEAGLPWYELYDADLDCLASSESLRNALSLKQIDMLKGVAAQHEVPLTHLKTKVTTYCQFKSPPGKG